MILSNDKKVNDSEMIKFFKKMPRNYRRNLARKLGLRWEEYKAKEKEE